jgi:6-phosphogluconolactonase (cycloisomerase 2 family)
MESSREQPPARGTDPSTAPRGSRLTIARALVVFLVFAAPATGSILVVLDALYNGQDGIQGLAGASGVAISDDGWNVYAVGALDDAVAVFLRDPETGLLSFVEYHQDGLDGVDNLRNPTDVAVSSDGRHVYVTSDLDNAIVVFRRTSFGRLAYVRSYVTGVDGVWGIGGASAVDLNREGSLVFVTGGLEDSLAVFARDVTSDALVFTDVENTYSGALGLTGASDVSVSPDGRHVYTSSDIDNAISIFATGSTRTTVDFVGWLQNGSAGVAGLAGASAITLDRDGGHVFATGALSNAVSVYERNIASGLLTPLNVYSNSQTGISGLGGASDVVLDRSSELVCVAGPNDDSVVLFRRGADASELEFIERLEGSPGSAPGLAGAQAIASSPNGLHLYVTAAYDDSLVTIATTSNIFADGFESGDHYRWYRAVPRLD